MYSSATSRSAMLPRVIGVVSAMAVSGSGGGLAPPSYRQTAHGNLRPDVFGPGPLADLREAG